MNVVSDTHLARQAAKKRGLEVMGLLGVLDLASQSGLLSLADAVEKLSQTSFRVEPRLIRSLLDRHRS